MAKRITSVLGIDVGSTRIKVCEMKTQGRDPMITAMGIVDTPEGAVDHTGVYNSDAVGNAIKQALANAGTSSNAVVVSIAGQASVLVRTVEVPKMNDAELKEHMQWEINRNIPFAESTVVSDFKPLGGDDPSSPNMDVVLAIAPQSAIDTMIECVKKAGKQTAAIDVEPLSAARSISTSYDDVLANKTVCLVEMGAKTTSINIYQGSKLLMPRQVSMGGEHFTKALSDMLHLSLLDAESTKVSSLEIPQGIGAAPPVPSFDPVGGETQQFQPYNPFSDDPTPAFGGNPFADTTAEDFAPAAPVDPVADVTPAPVADPEVMRLYNAIAGILDEFLAEVRRSVDYFRSKGGEVDLLLLAGGGTKIKGLAQFLSTALGIECEMYDPLRKLSLNDKKVAPGFAEEHKTEFAIAVGNALHVFFD